MTSQFALAGLKKEGTSGSHISRHKITSKSQQAIRKSAHAVLYVRLPPLDFSFCSLTSLEDCESDLIAPRNEELQNCWQKKDSSASVAARGKSSCLFQGNHFKLSHNNLKTLTGLRKTVFNIFINPESLSWVDVSFNNLDKINTDLAELVNLKILYIHGNDIDNLKEVHKLASLRMLHKLTLNGNPIDQNKFYRSYVISHVPSLLSLDFSTVTRGDRATAHWYMGVSEGERRRRPRKASY